MHAARGGASKAVDAVPRQAQASPGPPSRPRATQRCSHPQRRHPIQEEAAAGSPNDQKACRPMQCRGCVAPAMLLDSHHCTLVLYHRHLQLGNLTCGSWVSIDVVADDYMSLALGSGTVQAVGTACSIACQACSNTKQCPQHFTTGPKSFLAYCNKQPTFAHHK